MNAFRRFLKWSRIEDENSVFSLTTVAFAVGCYSILAGREVPLPALASFALVLGAYHGKRYWQNQRTQKAMEITHEQSLAQTHNDHEQVVAEMEHAHDEKVVAISENAEALAKKIEAVEAKVKELATPERLEAIRRSLGRG